jgi:hypothetical protein
MKTGYTVLQSDSPLALILFCQTKQCVGEETCCRGVLLIRRGVYWTCPLFLLSALLAGADSPDAGS